MDLKLIVTYFFELQNYLCIFHLKNPKNIFETQINKA